MRRMLLSMLTLGLGVIASSQVNAQSFSSGIVTQDESSNSSGVQQSLGFDFTAHSAISVTSLGLYDANGNTTILTGQTVYLEDLTSVKIIGQASISALNQNEFNYATLASSVLLNTTDTYSVFSLFAADAHQYGLGSPIVFSSDITDVTIGGDSTGYTQGASAQAPTVGESNILAVNFNYTLPSSVPEPASIAMMGLGLAGVALARRRMARRSD